MITSKRKRCRQWALAYVTRYPGLTSKQIAASTADYTEIEVLAALFTLVAFQHIVCKDDSFRLKGVG